MCAPLGPVTADLVRAARRAGVRCHVVAVAGRPDALPCNESATAGDVGTESPVALERSLPEAVAGRSSAASVAALRGWRGSDFPLRLPLEDGPIDAASVERLAALRDRHVGETAVIIGNGPSLNDTELEMLTDVATFGVNAIFLAAERFPKPITYYVVEDTSVFSENIEAIKAFDAEWKLFPAMYRPSFDESEIDDHTIFFRMNAGFYGRNTGTTCHPRFSLDPTQRLYCGQSVTIINLQLAHWMGFQRVVLIGMDFSLPDSRGRRPRRGADHVAKRRPEPLPPGLLRGRQVVEGPAARPRARQLPPRRRDLPGDRSRDRQRHRGRQARSVPARAVARGHRCGRLSGPCAEGSVQPPPVATVVVGCGAVVVGGAVVGGRVVVVGAVVGGSVVATVVVTATVVDVVDGGSVDSTPVVVVASDDVVVASPPPAVTATRPKSNPSGCSAGRAMTSVRARRRTSSTTVSRCESSSSSEPW